MPAAEPVQNWIFEEVLPSIAKTGQYKLSIDQHIDAALNEVVVANRAAARKSFLKASEETKDKDSAKKGSKGGKAFWKKYFETKKRVLGLEKRLEEKEELAQCKDKFRQTKLDLDYFKVLSKCLDP